jgi:protein ImuB
VVLAMDAAARHADLRIGMPAAKAQALVPGLIVRDMEPAADAEALNRLALWALRHYAPIVAADPPDGLVIDTTGAAHLYDGEDAMLKGMVARLAASGIAACAAIADSWGAAYALARYGARPVLVIPMGESVKAILDLPIASLRLPKTMVKVLSDIGFACIGELAAKPRAPLALRFGPELGRHLDQAMGRLSEPIDPIRPPDLIDVAVSSPSRSARLRQLPATRGSSLASSAKRSRPKLLARGVSICSFTGSTTVSRPSASARRCRCATLRV